MTLGAVPSRLSSLAELAGQVYDPNDATGMRYRQMVADSLDPKKAAQKAADYIAAKKLLEKKVVLPTRTAMLKIGVISD